MRTIPRVTGPAIWALAVHLAWIGASPSAQPADGEGPRLLAVESGGQIPLQGETRLRVEGISGTLAIRSARDEVVIFAARSLEDRRSERELEVWVDGSEMILRAPESAADQRYLVEVAVATGMRVEVRMRDGHLEVAGLYSGLEVQAVDSSIEARGVRGSIETRIEGGSLLVDGIEGDLDLEAARSEVILRRVPGATAVTQSGGTLELGSLSGDVELQLTDVRASGTGFRGRVHVDAEGGSLELGELFGGFEGYLRGCPLELAQLRGLIRVDTDRQVSIDGASAQLFVESYGGEIRVSDNVGPTELSSFDAAVIAERIGGTLQIRGNQLQVIVRESKGNVLLDTVSSTVRIEKAEGALTLTNDFGDVVVEGAAGEVTIDSRNGEVVATDLQGPIRLEADGARVEVGWKEMPDQGECRIRNRNGEVLIRLPLRATGQLTAESSYGRVSASVRGVRVDEDERRAVGILGGKNTPTIEVKAAGDLVIAPLQQGLRAQ